MTEENFDDINNLIKRVNDSADDDNGEDLQETKAIQGDGNGNGKAKNTESQQQEQEHEQTIEQLNEYLAPKIPNRDYAEYIIASINKTVKQEDSLVRQLLYTALSKDAASPQNLAVLAPTSEGKTHPVLETLQYFPHEDVWTIGSMSPKVIIRQNGILVDKDNNPLDPRIAEIKKQIKHLKHDLEKASNSVGIQRAAQLIALNKTCFNGLYRVNPKGHFNVPLGYFPKQHIIYDRNNLLNVSQVLRNSNRNVTIRVCDYKQMVFENAKEGDFIYLDPPYSPQSSTACFTSYTNNGFSNKDQERLAQVFRQLDEMKCKVMLTNSNTPLVRELYAPFAITEVDSKRAINCKASKRQSHTDLIIRNYSYAKQ